MKYFLAAFKERFPTQRKSKSYLYYTFQISMPQ